MKIPMNKPCVVRKKGKFNIYGQPIEGPPIPTKCAIVKLKAARTQTTLRTDTGASQGHGEEIVADVVLLMRPQLDVAIDDVVEVAGLKMRVESVQARYSVGSPSVHHLQVEGTICR